MSEPATLAAEVRAAVLDGIGRVDQEQQLSPPAADQILAAVAGEVLECLASTGRTALGPEDLNFIRRRVAWMILELESPGDLQSGPTRRFQKMDRVVCQLGGGLWAPGAIQEVNQQQPDPADAFREQPYVVRIDGGPQPRMVSIAQDSSFSIRAELCFGQRESALEFSLACLPQQRAGRPAARRFGPGDRVTCAVEDATGDLSVWAAGSVLTVDDKVDGSGREGVVVPYRVRLDTGCTVLVHRDEDWLVRDLELQPEGIRQAADGSRCLERFAKRRREDGTTEVIDHRTRRVRIQKPSDDSEDGQ